MLDIGTHSASASVSASGEMMCGDAASRAEAFDLSEITDRYAKKFSLSKGVAEEHEKELKRFLTLAARNKDKRYGMAGPVDDLWHEFIVTTHLYCAFCDSIAGRYIHHAPAIDREDADVNQSLALRGYTEFLSDYKAAFGVPPPAHIWPTPFDYKSLTAQPRCIVKCST